MPSTGAIRFEPGNSGGMYPSRSANISLKNTTGTASARLIQNRSLNCAA